MEDNLLKQLVSEPTGDGALTDLLLVNRGLVGEVKVGGHLEHSNHELTEFVILGKVRRVLSRSATHEFQGADFGLLRGLLGGVPWETVLKGRGVQEGWVFFKKKILKVQEQAIPAC